MVKAQTAAQAVEVRADAEGLVSHAGAFLLTELADRTGLTDALSEAMAPSRERRSAHDPGVVLRDLAVSIADGGDCVSDLGVLAGHWPVCCAPATPAQTPPPITSVSYRRARAATGRGSGPRDPRAGRLRRRSKAFAADCRDTGIGFSLSYEIRDRAREAIVALAQSAWQAVIDAKGEVREGAQLAELSEEIDPPHGQRAHD